MRSAAPYGATVALRPVTYWLVTLYVLWSLAWILRTELLPASMGSEWSFLYWTAMKLLIWLGLPWGVLRSVQFREWVGTGRRPLTGRVYGVIALAALWIASDQVLAWLELKPGPGAFQGSIWSLVNVIIVAPLFEELVFRGVLWSRCSSAGVSTLKTSLLSTFTFALLHVPGWLWMSGFEIGLVEIGTAFGSILFCGFVFGFGRWLTGSVWGAVFLHFANNAYQTGLWVT